MYSGVRFKNNETTENHCGGYIFSSVFQFNAWSYFINRMQSLLPEWKINNWHVFTTKSRDNIWNVARRSYLMLRNISSLYLFTQIIIGFSLHRPKDCVVIIIRAWSTTVSSVDERNLFNLATKQKKWAVTFCRCCFTVLTTESFFKKQPLISQRGNTEENGDAKHI